MTFSRPKGHRTTAGFGLLALLLALLLGCAGQSKRDDLLEATLRAYGSHVRWGEIELAMAYIDPEELAKRPPSATELERFKQVRMAAYREISREATPDGRVQQVVEIEFVNVHTQGAGGTVDRQLWRYDEEAQRWWLTTGLPDLTTARR